MSAKQTKIDLVIGAVDKFTAPLRKFNDKLEAINQRFSGISRAFSNLSSEGARLSKLSGFDEVSKKAANLGQKVGNLVGAMGRLAAAGTATALSLGYAFKTQFVDVASEFERFETILTTLNQGDAGKAKGEMDWISAFAAKTPYELAEVTDSFVKLRSYGLDPTKGLLQTLGDTASSMGKPLEQAVEAIADAVNGENERLKEFGIKASKVGENIVYAYTNAAGEQAKLMAKANDNAAIQATLTHIWAEKYGGGMDAQSKTFAGMVSNLADSWSQFTNLVMSNGVFDWMKSKLSGVLAKIDEMSQNGTLQAWAKDIGDKLTMFFDQAWSVLPKLWDGIQAFGDKLSWVADLLGGWENLGLVLAASFSGLLAPLVALVGAFFQLGIAMMANPFGLVVAGIAAVAAGIYALWKYWDDIIGWVNDAIPDWMKSDDKESKSSKDAQSSSMGSIAGFDGGSLAQFSQNHAVAMEQRPTTNAAAIARESSIQEMHSSHTTKQESTVKVEVVAPQGTRVSQEGAPVDMDTVYLGQAAYG